MQAYEPRHSGMDPGMQSNNMLSQESRMAEANMRRGMPPDEVGMMSKSSMQQMGMYPSETGKFMHVGSSMHSGYGHPGYGQQHPSYISRDDTYSSESQRRTDDRFDDRFDPMVSSAVREVASRMNEVSLTQQQQQQMHMSRDPRDYGHRPGPEDLDRATSGADPRDPYVNMGLGPDMSFQDPREGHMKMHGGFPGMYHGPMAGHHHPSMPYVPAQPPSLPWTGMQPMGYGPMPGRFDYGPATTQAAKHNKYCHFCQHVKVRASGMLACCNKDCTRRFCEHCLSKSIGDDVNPQTSSAWIGGQWHCPVCRKLCCCAIGECDKNHRHCKAYRYRVRRAEQQASKRAGTSAEGAESGGESPHEGDDHEQQAVKEEETVAKPGAEAGAKAEGAGRAGAEREAPPKKQPESVQVKQEEAPQAMPRSAQGQGQQFKSPMPSPQMQRQMRHLPPGAEGQPGFDFNDVQTVADSWLKLFQDEDVEDDSFLFGAGQEGGRMPRHPPEGAEWQGSLLKEESRGSISMQSTDSTESLQKLLREQTAEGLRRSSSNDLLAAHGNNPAPAGLPYNNSSDSLPSLGSQSWNPSQVQQQGAMPRNMSTDSLGGMMPRNFSSNSLGAVFEQCEGWQGEQEEAQGGDGGPPGPGGTAADFDFLSRASAPGGSPQSPPRPSPRAAPGMYQDGEGHLQQRGLGRPPVSAFSNGQAYDQGQGQASGATETRKRMNRTSSHNNLVRESLRGQQGMPRPPSTEKLSRMCRTDMGGYHDGQMVGMGMAPTKEDKE